MTGGYTRKDTAMSEKRGRCPVCDRDMLLKKDGTLRHHGGPVGSGMWNEYRSYRCAGVGQKPTALLSLGEAQPERTQQK